MVTFSVVDCLLKCVRPLGLMISCSIDNIASPVVV